MNNQLYFTAQALDNTSSDHYKIGEDILSDNNTVERMAVTELISKITDRGERLILSTEAELLIWRNLFLIQVYSEQQDVLGRKAPILCCGKLNFIIQPVIIIQAIQQFAENIGRTVSPLHLMVIQVAIERAICQQSQKKFNWIIPACLFLGMAGTLYTLYCKIFQ